MVKQDIQKECKTKKQMYRASEVAILLSVAKSTIWLYKKQGKLRAYKLSPRVTVFDINDINNLIHNQMDESCNG